MQHVDITDPNIHEPKGASTAPAGSVYVANGAGSGSWELRYEDAPVYAEIDRTSATFTLTSASDVMLTGFALDDYAASKFTLTNTNSRLTVLEAGLYNVSFSLTLTPNSAIGGSNEVVTAKLLLNGTVSNPQRSVPITVIRNSGTGDPYTVSIRRLVDVPANAYFEVVLNNAAATRDYTVKANLNLVKFGNL